MEVWSEPRLLKIANRAMTIARPVSERLR
jgi:hypothetical protein